MTSLKIIEFRPDSKLLNTKFDGYKLSLEPIAKKEVNLEIAPDQVQPDDDQYTLQHAQLFGLQNHLVRDPWESRCGYFIDAAWTVQKVKYNVNTDNVQLIKNNFRLPRVDRQSGDYNFTFCFPSEKYCVLCNGAGVLYLIDTGDRYNNSEWKCIFSGNTTVRENQNFLIKDARFEIIDGKREIHCILMSICKQEAKYHCCLDWISLVLDSDKKWTIKLLHEISSKSLPVYCALEPKSKAILLSSDSPFEWKANNDDEEISDPNENDVNEKNTQFTWSQTDEDITVNFDIDINADKQDFKVICKNNYVNVTWKSKELFNGELYDRIDYGLTTWTLENESFKLNLVKAIANKYWPKLTLEENDETDTREVETSKTAPPYSLTETEEECDGPGELENDFFLARFDASTHSATHKINLSTSKPLFTITLHPGQLPALAIRSDVDTLICLPKLSPTNPNDWQITHEGTLDAFGYVQASKAQKKFIECSPDMTYAVICESSRHVFFYLDKYSTATTLKNRNGGKVSIGQQKLFTMEGSDQILGLIVENEITFLLTKGQVLCLKIKVY